MNETCKGKDITIIESPCIKCDSVEICETICYKRLEWAIFDFKGSVSNESFSTYGNSREISHK